VARHAKDVAEVLDGLSLDRVVAVDGSMRASTWWSYLDLFGPGRLRGPLSVDQTPKMLNADGWDNGFYGFTPDSAGRYFNGDLTDTGHGPDRSRMRATIAQLMARVGPDEPLTGQLSPNGRAVVIPDSGHPVNFDQPEAFNQVLTDFVAGVAAR
jgi:pimeloyl-ACP methyl ester carboxylesterase